jgi:hypothetical protein
VSPLLEYIEFLETQGTEFGGISTPLALPDVRALLLAGHLYLRRDWLSGLRVPIEYRVRPQQNQKSKAPPGYVPPRGGKGSFDVAEALGVARTDEYRARLNKLTIATCYGLWAPQALGDEIEVDRRHVQARRTALLARVWDANTVVGESKLRERFHKVLDHATERRWRDSEFLATCKWNPEEAFRRFNERLFGRWEGGRIARPGRLSPELRERMADPIYTGLVPNLFDDPSDGEEFLSTFFESLEVESYKPKSQNRIWHVVRSFCDLEHAPYAADDIRIRLEAFLNVLPFDDALWKTRVEEGGPDESNDDSDLDDE